MRAEAPPTPAAETGLRERKKAQRRGEIIRAAKALFARQGFDATTMAEIAQAAGISPPTVFNYFGSKDGVLIALIAEGTREARENDRALYWQDGTDLADLLENLFLRVSTRTLEIADKQVWRYAEAAAIRHPQADLSRHYAQVSEALVGVITDFLDSLDLRTRAGTDTPPDLLGRLFYDVWNPLFLALITDETQSLTDHRDALARRIRPLVEMIFTSDCIRAPRLKARSPSAPSS